MTSANLLAEDRALSIRSDIRTKSLPDSPFVRRGWSRGAKVSLKQSGGEFEHLPEVTPHLLAFQARNNAGAAKAMNQARANGHRRQRPALLRALEITARRARADRTITPWLAVPALLRSMQITQAVLPCLTIGDKALRLSPRDTQAIVLRNLRSLTDRAEEGLVRLQALAEDRLRAAAALHGAQDRKSTRLNSSH